MNTYFKIQLLVPIHLKQSSFKTKRLNLIQILLYSKFHSRPKIYLNFKPRKYNPP